MEWIYVKDRLPPDMVPVTLELNDPLVPGLTTYNALYSESMKSWVKKDPKGSGEYVPSLMCQKYAYRWRPN